MGKRVLSAFLSGLVTIAIGDNLAYAQDAYCDALQSKLIANRLYAATCPKQRCLIDLASPVTLKKDRSYQLLYRFADDTPAESLVLVKSKHWSTAPAGKSLRVSLRRERISFACNPFTGKVYGARAFPETGEETVSLAGYDSYHRFGFAGVDDRSKLGQFHISYKSGERCVWTADARRVRQFLLHTPNYHPGWFARLFIRSGASVSYALAEENPDYADLLATAKISVLMKSYERSVKAAGCMSFGAESRYDRSDVQIIDLERIPLIPPRVWRVEYQ